MKKAFKYQGIVPRLLPVCVWLTAVAGVIFLYSYRYRSITFKGMAMASEQRLSAPESGFIRSLNVELLEFVRKGDVLAVVELGNPLQHDYLKALTEARKATARLEVQRLEAELDAAHEQILSDLETEKNNRLADYSDLALVAERAHLDWLSIKTELQLDRGRLASLELERKAVKDLFERRAVHRYEKKKIEADYTALAEKVAGLEKEESQARENLTEARQRLAQFNLAKGERSSIDKFIEPYRRELAVQEGRLEELFVPVKHLELHARFDGVVSAINVSEGQGFQAGDLLMTLSPPEAEYIVGWIDPERAGDIYSNHSVEIVSHEAPRQKIMSEISVVGSSVERLPEQLWSSQNSPRWGLPVKISVPQGSRLANNQVVGLKGL